MPQAGGRNLLDHAKGIGPCMLGAGMCYRRCARNSRAIGKQKHTPGVSLAPKDNGPVLILLRGKDFVEVQGKPVEVSNVQRAKVVVEGVVE